MKMGSDDDPLRGGTPLDAVLRMTQKALNGELVGEEQVNGLPVRHYRIDSSATNAATLAFDDNALHKRATELKLTGGDAFLAVEGNYLVKLAVDYEGLVSEYGTTGKIHLNFDLTHPTPQPVVEVPKGCDASLAAKELPKQVGQAIKLESGMFTAKAPAGRITSAITLTMNGNDSAGKQVSGDLILRHEENLAQRRSVSSIEGVRMAEKMGLSQAAASAVRKISVYKIGGDYYAYFQGKQVQDYSCATIKSEVGLETLQMLDPNIELGVKTLEWLLYGVSLEQSTRGAITLERYKLDADVTNKVITQAYRTGVNLPVLVQGTAVMARRKFTVADMTNSTTPDGRDLVYMQHLEATYNGTYKSMDFTGMMKVIYDFALPDSGVDIALPGACLNATGS
jgi:hypothetical protein